MTRRIVADLILPMTSEPLANGVISLDDRGVVTGLTDDARGADGLERREGIVIPSFVNAHTHLELSHLRGAIPSGLGLKRFLAHVGRLKRSRPMDRDSVRSADAEMSDNGIGCVGDVSNTTFSFATKSRSRTDYHSFLEVCCKRAADVTDRISQVSATSSALPSRRQSIVPHAAYSARPELLEFISRRGREQGEFIFSIHNQESRQENLIFDGHRGEIVDMLREKGVDCAYLGLEHDSPLEYLLASMDGALMRDSRCLFVHNTFTAEKDIDFVESRLDHAFWVLCPKSNLHIEGALPDVDLFARKGVNVAIGTDSLGSNDSLSILSELQAINRAYPHVPVLDLLRWGTLGGARALGARARFGSIDLGRECGLALLRGVSLEDNCLEHATVERLAGRRERST